MNKIDTFFDKIYVITCWGDTHRRNHVCEQMKMYNIKNYTFVHSIDAYLLKEKDELSRQDLSLILSHINCVKDASINQYRQILILEDDFKFEKDFDKDFNDIIDNIPSEWSYLHLGVAKWTKDIFNVSGSYINDYIQKYIFAPGSHCIGVHKSCYEFIIENFLKYEMPIDLIYEKVLCPKYNSYISKKSICDAMSAPHKNYWNIIPNFDPCNFFPSRIRDDSKSF